MYIESLTGKGTGCLWQQQQQQQQQQQKQQTCHLSCWICDKYYFIIIIILFSTCLKFSSNIASIKIKQQTDPNVLGTYYVLRLKFVCSFTLAYI